MSTRPIPTISRQRSSGSPETIRSAPNMRGVGWRGRNNSVGKGQRRTWMTFWRGICETMKVAIIHYWLVGMRGGERVLERLCDLYPDADIFTHVHVPEAMSPTIRKMNVKTKIGRAHV